MDRNLVVQSRRWERERRKEANIPLVLQPASMFQESAKNREIKRKRGRERKKERKKERQGDQSSDGAKLF